MTRDLPDARFAIPFYGLGMGSDSNVITHSSPEADLAERLDLAERRLLDYRADLAVPELAQIRVEALERRDTEALKRVASIASTYRSQSERKLDRLHFIADGNVRVIESGELDAREAAKPEPGTRQDLNRAIVVHLAMLVFWGFWGFGGVGLGLDDASQTEFLIAMVIYIGAGVVLWLAALALIIARWHVYRERAGDLVNTTWAWMPVALLWFPVLACVSSRFRRFAGLCRAPR